jgi:hypothetical protein
MSIDKEFRRTGSFHIQIAIELNSSADHVIVCNIVGIKDATLDILAQAGSHVHRSMAEWRFGHL